MDVTEAQAIIANLWHGVVGEIPGAGKETVHVEATPFGLEVFCAVQSTLAHRVGSGQIGITIQTEMLDDDGALRWLRDAFRAQIIAECPYSRRYLDSKLDRAAKPLISF